MELDRRTLLALISGAAAAPALGGPALASGYPTKNVRIVAPFSGGAATDVIARLMAEQYTRELGQSFIVEPVLGAGGTLAANAVARAAADGYTLGIGSPSSHASAGLLMKDLPYNAQRDFAPVVLLARFPFVLVTSAALPVSSVKELLDYAKERPNQVRFGSLGNGTGPHFAGELLKQKTGLQLLHVPYRDNGLMITDLMAGRIHMMFYSLPAIQAGVEQGSLKILAVAQPERWSRLPDTPSILEAGLPDFDLSTWSWMGLFGPAGMPREAIDKVNQASLRAFEVPAVKARFEQVGAITGGGTPEDLGRHLASEIATIEALVKSLGLTPA